MFRHTIETKTTAAIVARFSQRAIGNQMDNQGDKLSTATSSFEKSGVPHPSAALEELRNAYVDRRTLAAALGVSVRTLDRWAQIKTGPPRVKVNGLALYRVDAVKEWLKAHESS